MKTKKMEFSEKKVVDECRTGEIKIKNGGTKRLHTPACILYTRGGAAPHLTNDLVDSFLDDFSGIHITLPTVFQHPGINVLKEYGKSIAEFLDIKKKDFIYCSVHDPSQKTNCSYNEEKNISVWNSSGRKKINVDLFLEFLTTFKPDIVQCLCDTVPSGQSSKRNKKSVDRTLKFLDEVLEYQKNHEALKSLGILGSIEGGDSATERTRSSLETSKRQVTGFVIEGIGPNSKNWTSLLKTSIKNLPRDKPRFFTGTVSPEDIFAALECGVDVFDSRYKEDFSPLVIGCCCYSCTDHTRAYVYHLLQTKEMLAQVLLMLHNFHQYLQFFKRLREAMNDDNYNAFKSGFLET